MSRDQLDEVAELFFVTFTRVGEEWTHENARKHVDESFFGECHFVAKEKNKIIGMLLAFPLTKVAGTELFIDTIAVSPDYQKMGIGTMLINKAFEYAKLRGFVAVSLQANKKLQSYNWYKSLGLSETGWIELIKLKKDL
ncbi:MAG: GNAT family N-acetyltransferase [Patescibacteria group bacterium]